jgi:hypothetical protein
MELPQEKVEAMTTAKWGSLCSQMHHYITEDRLSSMKQDAEREASEDCNSGVGREESLKKNWTTEEKWNIYWITEYTKRKCRSNKGKAYIETRKNNFEKHCPYKTDISRNNSQYSYLKKTGIFNQYKEVIDKEIEYMIANDICPLENPIPMPQQPTTLAEEEPTTLAEEEPPTLAEEEPPTLAEEDPTTLAEEEPTTLAEEEPTTLAEEEHTTLAEEEPTTLAEEEPTTLAEEEPTTLAEEEPTTLAEEEPTTLAEEEPTTLAEEEPTTLAVEEPTTLVVEQPTTLTIEDPTTLTVEDPMTLAEEQPTAPLVAEQPTTLTVEDPTTLTVEQPTTTLVEERHTTLAEELPTPLVEERIESITPRREPAISPEERATSRNEFRTGHEWGDVGVDEEVIVLENKLAETFDRVLHSGMDTRQPLFKINTNKKFHDTLMTINRAIPKFISADATLTEVNALNYAAAFVIQSVIVPQKQRSAGDNSNKKTTKNNIPKWRKRLEEIVQKKRGEISRINEFLKSNNNRRLVKHINNIKIKYKIRSNNELKAKAIQLGMEVTAKAKEIKNREARFLTRKQNSDFERNQKQFFRSMNNDEILVKNPPDHAQLNDFWRTLYETPKSHNTDNQWIADIREEIGDKNLMENVKITSENFVKKVNKSHNFKSPGIDKVTNFWLKQITSLHKHYINCFNKILTSKEASPEWLTCGRTTLLPKSATETMMPHKYRPICCLPTAYKILTGILADKMYEHLMQQDMLEHQQKGCIRNTLGTKDQLLLNKTILENCKKRNSNLSMAWIDYKKAFDSVPHSWLVQSMQLYKISPNIIQFMKTTMPNWKTQINLRHENGVMIIENVKIKRGIFQGDSLSPLLFCLAVDPLSKILNASKTGYNMYGRKRENKNIINHLLYMDDLKLFAQSEQALQEQLEHVHRFSKDIHMEFGLDKCAKITIKGGKRTKVGEFNMDNDTTIKDLDVDECYKYLGVEESDIIEQKKMRSSHIASYTDTINKILKTYLSPKNKILAINQIAVSRLQYSFGVIEWSQKEINNIDVQTRKLLIKNKIFYKDQNHDRLYLPRAKGGMGLIEIDTAYKAAIVSLAQYIRASNDANMSFILKHQEQRPASLSILKQADIFLNGEEEGVEEATKRAKKRRKKYINQQQHEGAERWLKSRRAGPFAELMKNENIDEKASFEWLRRGILQYDGERIILAAQDQGLYTNAFKKVMGLTQNDKCRFCKEMTESVSHMLSGCKILLSEGRYTTRHNNVCRVIHWRLCRYYGFDTSDVAWKHVPQGHLENSKAKLTYDVTIPAGRHVTNAALRPDIVLIDKRTNKALIIDVSVPNDFGISRQEREKIIKYQDLKNDMKDTFELQEVEVVPVIIGSTAVIKNNFHKYTAMIPGNVNALELQREVLRESIAILKRALGCKLVA